MNNIKKSANKLRKELNYKITPGNIIKYLQGTGCEVKFFEDTDDIFKTDELIEYSRDKNAFTSLSDDGLTVYIRRGLSEENLLISLLHETAHVIFKHLEIREDLRNKRKEELTAEVFAYTVLNPPKTNRLILIIAALSVAFNFCLVNLAVSETVLVSKESSISTTDYIEHVEYVCITATGTKYHRENCGYVHNATAYIERSEAEKLFDACKRCNP